MNTGRTLISALLVFSIATGVFALERNAKMIDTLYLESSDYDYGQLRSINLSVENMTAAKNESWAIIADLGLGNIDYDNMGDEDFWSGSLGVKYYLTTVTSLSLMGSYTEMGFSTGPDIEFLAGTLEVIQRLFPTSFAVSPFVKISASVQEVDHPANFLSLPVADSFTELVLKGTVGCDFLMNDEFAFVFSLGYSESEDLDDGGDTSDGLSAVVAMKYYWKQ